MTAISVDFSRSLNKKQRAAFVHRRERLSGQFGESVAGATSVLAEHATPPGGVVLRQAFAALDKPLDRETVSDRKAPRRELRPSATRISSSQGAALRFYLALLAYGQSTTRAGSRVRLPGLPIAEFGGKLGWTDFVATPAVASGKGATMSSVRDLKGRTLRTALDTLHAAKLVQLPGVPGRRGRHEGFQLLHEAGAQMTGDPVPYTVPSHGAHDIFRLPSGFIANGWLHILEDSEITLLLMVACGLGTLPESVDLDLEPGEVAIPAEVRLATYGIHRDPFSSARKTLELFGLLDVREVGRHNDGRATEDERRLHRLALSPPGFEQNALDAVTTAIDAQLNR